MKLLSPSKSKRDNEVEAEQKSLARLRLQRATLEEQKRLSELDWEPEKKKKWDEFCAFNQDVEQKKAKLIREVSELEAKRDALIEHIKIYI